MQADGETSPLGGDSALNPGSGIVAATNVVLSDAVIPDYEWVFYIGHRAFGVIGDKDGDSLILAGPAKIQIALPPPKVAGGAVGISLLIIIAALVLRGWVRRSAKK